MKRKIALIISKFLIIYYKWRYGGKVRFGKNVIVSHKLKIKGKGKLIIGDECNLWTHEEANRFYFYDSQAHIEIGKKNRLNGVTFHCETSIKTGNECLIASAILMDTDFHDFDDPNHVLYGNQKSKPIQIGDKVWIGGQSVLLKGSKIGNGSVIGFRSVITKSFPENVVIAGNPGRIVKEKK